MNKILNIDSFQMNLFKTDFFPTSIVKFLSYFIIIVEIIVVLCLLFFKKFGLKFLLGMLLAFTLYISVLNAIDKYEVCGCGGILNGLKYKIHLIINIGIILVTLLIHQNIKPKESED